MYQQAGKCRGDERREQSLEELEREESMASFHHPFRQLS
jgi:hypothetical protein